MKIKNKIQKSKKYIALAITILALSSWVLTYRPHDNHAGEKAA